MHFYNAISCFGIFELLGKDLNVIMFEGKGGFSVEVIKKVAKDILSALKTLHVDCKIIHGDIKPGNIATSISKANVRRQFDGIVKSDKHLECLRMSVKQKTDFDVERKRRIEGWLNKLPKSETEETNNDLTFKLIDFGMVNVGFFKIIITLAINYLIIENFRLLENMEKLAHLVIVPPNIVMGHPSHTRSIFGHWALL